MKVKELQRSIEMLIENGLNPDADVVFMFRSAELDDILTGGPVRLTIEQGCADDEYLEIFGSDDPDDFEKTEPDIPIRTLRLVR